MKPYQVCTASRSFYIYAENLALAVKLAIAELEPHEYHDWRISGLGG